MEDKSTLELCEQLVQLSRIYMDGFVRGGNPSDLQIAAKNINNISFELQKRAVLQCFHANNNQN